MKQKGLDRTQLKLLAILAMVVDHTAWGFVDFMTPLGQIMHLFGRLTLPIMCFFIAEGFRHTTDLKRYLYRMMAFAIAAVIPFYLFFHEEYGYRQNIIFDLTLALAALAVCEHKTWNRAVRALLVTLLFLVSLSVGGWVIMPILYTLVFYYGKSFRQKVILFIGATCLLQAILLPLIVLNERFHFSHYNWTVPERLYLFGFIFALIPLAFYNGKKGSGFGGRYFFYIFYPAHFLVLVTIRQFLTGFTAQQIYIQLHAVALFIGLALLIYVILQPTSRAQMAVTFLMTASNMYIFGFLMEITSHEVAGVYTATKLQYFAESFVIIGITLCMQELCHTRIPYPVYAVEVVITSIVMYCMFTWEENHLMYTGISINTTDSSFPHMQIEGYGPAFYLFLTLFASVCVMSVGIGIHSARHSDRIQRTRLRLLLFAMLSMWVPYLMKAFGLVLKVEFPALFIPVAAFFITLALVRYSYLDSVSLGFSNAVNQGREGILIIDRTHRILYFNDWVCGLFGKLQQYEDAWRVQEIRDAFLGNHETLSRDGHTYELRVEPLIEQGHETGEILWVFDLTEHYRYLDKMKEQAATDSLTGINNRAWFENEMRSLLSEQVGGGFFMADLDHFKKVNDSFGHQAGDAVLIAFAEALRSLLEKSPGITVISGRIGGDEFCLYYEKETDRKVLEGFAEALIDGFDQAIAHTGYRNVTSLSVGIAVVHPEELPVSVWTSYTKIHDRADQALYQAKNSGRRTWRFYEEPREQNQLPF